LGIGDWGLGIGDWGFGPKTQNPKTQTPKPQPKNYFIKKNLIFYFIKNNK